MSNHLLSWNDTPTKKAILDFVAAVTDESSPDYVPPAERIATFDNDGTLWCEKPMPIQLFYILRALAAQVKADPSLKTKQPWKAVVEKKYGWFGDALIKHYHGDDSDVQIMLGGILGLSDGKPVLQAETEAREFVENESHPTLGIKFKEAIYQPMIELLQYLEANGFTNYIVSGGGRDFMRGVTEDLYNVPRERVLGTRVAYKYVEKDGVGYIQQAAKLDIMDDGPGKPISIWNVIGRRPILAGGNSNGDMPMMRLAGGKSLPALRLLVVHDDADREFDDESGAEDALRAFKEGGKGWTLISIKQEWRKVFPVDR